MSCRQQDIGAISCVNGYFKNYNNTPVLEWVFKMCPFWDRIMFFFVCWKLSKMAIYCLVNMKILFILADYQKFNIVWIPEYKTNTFYFPWYLYWVLFECNCKGNWNYVNISSQIYSVCKITWLIMCEITRFKKI